ncbi:DNA-directed DNA polymerase [Tanacetum coccineum]
MAETMEQYISKTRTDYGSGVARPKIDNKDQFKLKGQFLKELRENTFNGSDHEDANEHIEKVLKIVDLFYVPNITQELDETLYQACERFKELLMKCPQHYLTEMQEPSKKWLHTLKNGTMEHLEPEVLKLLMVECEQCKGPHYTKDCPLKEEGKTLEEAYYTQFGGPFQGGGYRATAPGFYQRNNANLSYQERRDKEIRASTDAAIRNQGASIKTLDIQIGQMSKKGSYGPQFSEAYLEASHINKFIPRKEKDPGSFTLPCFINNVSFDNALYRTVKYPKGIAKNVLVGIGKFVFLIDFIILDMPEDIKVPLILERPFLSTARAKIDVFERTITLRVGEERKIFKSVKPASSLIKRVYMLSLRERMELDLEARLMGETLVLNRSLDLFFEDYIELNDLNVPLELRRDQVDDLMPTIEEVLEDMDAYRDEGIGDVIFSEPFLREVRINAKRFRRNYTIQMVSEEDKMNGISRSYQKLKGFYKGVL